MSAPAAPRSAEDLPATGPSAEVTASVVVCAYTEERWDDIVAAVGSVRAQHPAPREIVVVVDHNPRLLARLAAEFTDAVDVRVVPNADAPGLSGAKNTGVRWTTGEVVAFLDDDAVAAAGWLSGLLAPYRDGTVMGVGGFTAPRWDARRPGWWPAEFDWVVGCSFAGREPGVVRNLLGGNASFRREVFAITGGFPAHIGRSAGNPRPLGCEETELCIRASLRRPGAVFIFAPDAVIQHRVPVTRGSFRYFTARCYAEGISKAMVTASVGTRAGLSAERLYTLTALPRGIVAGLRDAARGDRWGVLRAGAIAAGLLCTVAGFVPRSLRVALPGRAR